MRSTPIQKSKNVFDTHIMPRADYSAWHPDPNAFIRQSKRIGPNSLNSIPPVGTCSHVLSAVPTHCVVVNLGGKGEHLWGDFRTSAATLSASHVPTGVFQLRAHIARVLELGLARQPIPLQ